MAAVVILGAGPAGLMAAIDLAEAGHDVTVLEAQDRVGGMAASIEVRGQRVDLGSHRLHPATPPDYLDMIRGWLGDDLQVRERNGRLRLGGRWLGFPLRAGDLARHMPPAFTIRTIADTLTGPLRRGDAASFGDAIRRRLGPTVAAEFYDPYAMKLYGVPADQLTVELADRRVSASSPGDIVKRIVRARRPEGRTFLYPRRGYGQIVEAMTDTARQLGVDLRLNEPATALTRPGDHTQIATVAGTYDADLTLSSIPVPALARLMSDVPEAVSQALDRLRTRAMVLVYLALETDRYTAFDAHYIPDPDCVTARLSEPKNYRDGDDPADTTVLCAEIACWPSDDVWQADKTTLAAMVTADLDRLGLPEPALLGVHVERLPSVYPTYEHRSAAARATVAEWAENLEGVVPFGRQGLGVPDNLHHVLMMGRAVAAVVDSHGRLDRHAWSLALRTFEDHVVED